MDLSSVGQELYDLLDDEKNVLSKYIVGFDQNQDDDSALRSIGERIGIYIPEREYSPVFLYEKLKEIIEARIDRDTIKDIINMLPDQYEKYLEDKNLSREYFYPLYSNRLLNLIKK